jgi:energy-coupling factor transport system substrate-specific component
MTARPVPRGVPGRGTSGSATEGSASRGSASRVAAIRVHRRSALAIAMASFIGLIAFGWPFVVRPGTFSSAQAPSLMFGVLLLEVLAVVFAGIADGGIDAKAIAMLGVLSAINAALRPLGGGTAGVETVFFLLVLAGRVFGPGFGFALGCTSLFASALLTGGVGPWLPYQMFGCAWIGMLAGLLPPAWGSAGPGGRPPGTPRKAELIMLAAYGGGAGYLFGFLLNLSFWPFSVDPGSSVAYQPGLPFIAQFHRYLTFDASTSLGWDTGRAITTALAILIIGPAALSAFRRAARKANFQPTITFAPPPAPAPPPVPALPSAPALPPVAGLPSAPAPPPAPAPPSASAPCSAPAPPRPPRSGSAAESGPGHASEPAPQSAVEHNGESS